MTASPVTVLPDGSGFFTTSGPLPKDHWIYEESGEPPMPLRCGVGPSRSALESQVRAAARYAVRAATARGAEMDFDPDALLQDLIVGLFGYHTEDGRYGSAIRRSSEEPESLQPGSLGELFPREVR